LTTATAAFERGVRARSERVPHYSDAPSPPVPCYVRHNLEGAGGTPRPRFRPNLRRDLNSLSDGTRDLRSRLFGVFPRPKRQRDKRSLVLAADAEAVARPATPLGSVTGITSLTAQFWYAVIVASYFWAAISRMTSL
jgi:hypothetical protein